MLTKKMLVAVLTAAGTLGSIANPLASAADSYRQIVIERAPPAPQAERVPAARRGYVWSPGYWNWTGSRHQWVKGSYVQVRRGHSYQANRWVERDGHWTLQRARWDRDGDGVPNNRDRDRDGDGVPNNRDARPDNPNRY